MKENHDQKSEVATVLGLPISALSYHRSIRQIVDLAKAGAQGFVCFANAHMTVEAHWDHEFAKQLQQARLVFADGVPLVWAARILNHNDQERVAGMDAFPVLLEQAESEKLPVYFYGETQHTLDKIQERIIKEYPQLQIAGMTSPPFKVRTEEEVKQDIDHINNSGAKLVFVALGCPKQEKWMAKHTASIQAILLGVGGAFPVFAQTQKRAPLWMRKGGLEWFFRFMQEPKRLFKRYLITNTIFTWLFFKDWATK